MGIHLHSGIATMHPGIGSGDFIEADPASPDDDHPIAEFVECFG